MALHPYLALAATVVCALVGYGGYRHGIDTERGRAAITHQQAIIAAADAARLDAEAEAARRATEAARLAAAAAASREARLTGQLNALRTTPRPDCALSPERVRDYNAAIAAANALAGAERMPAPLPATTDAQR